MEQTPDEIKRQMSALQSAGKIDEAIALCTAAMSAIARGDVHRLLDYRAFAKWMAGEREAAMADMEAAIKAAPHWAGHLYQYALWSIELGSFQDAEKTSRQLIAVEIERSSVAFLDSARFFLSFALLQLGQWAEALDAARAVQDEKPIWVAGRFLSKSDIAEAAAKRKTL
jgi:tetratricopeptide (TPR) repeat protein